MSPDKVKLVLLVEGLKQLAEEMAVGGYFSENHEASEQELPEMERGYWTMVESISRCRSS